MSNRPDHFRELPGFNFPINTREIQSYSPGRFDRRWPDRKQVYVTMTSGQAYVVENCTIAGFELAMFGTKEQTDAGHF